MSNKPATNEDEVFEIIELAIDEIDLLTRAFKVIGEVCDELRNPEVSLDSPSKQLVN